MAEKLAWDYVYAFDPVPQQTEEFNKLSQYYKNLKAGRLTSTRCEECGEISWPPRTVCPNCMSDRLAWTDLPEEGEIVVATAQESGAFPGFKAPLIFGMLDFGVVRFIGKLVDIDPAQLAPGTKVRLKVETEEDGRVLPAFTPV